MSQHDYDLANQACALVRSDLNTLLGAVATRNSGASAPGTTFAYESWVDTTNGALKHRNAANSGWIVDATVDETFVLSRSSNTLLDVSDWGKTVIATAGFTQTFDVAATLGDGWYVNYKNASTSIVTLDPNSSETIDGAATFSLHPGEACRITSNGTNLLTVGRRGYIVKRKTADETVASSTALQDDDHLQFSIGANEEWVAYFHVTLNAVTGGGLKVSVNAPAGATINVGGFNHLASAVDGSASGTQTIDAAYTSRTNAGATDNALLLVAVWILNGSTAGTVVLRWAQSTSSASGTTFKKGSSMVAFRVES